MEQKHPIEEIMRSTMENIKDMVDVNTIIGDPVFTNDGTAVIPVSRVGFGFVSGGGEFKNQPAAKGDRQPSDTEARPFPFAGGSGAGVSVCPVAFVVVQQGDVKLLPIHYNTPYDRLVEMIPGFVKDVKELVTGKQCCEANTDPTPDITCKAPSEEL